MKSRTKLASLVTAVALSALIAVPALGAAPTYTGQLYCEPVYDPGTLVELDPINSWTKKEINAQVRFWESTGDYVKNSCYADVVQD